MTQEVKVDSASVILDSETVYSGMDKPSDEEKLIRKAIGFPVTKQLIYYRDKRSASSVVNVESYKLVEMYDITDRWYTVEITTNDGETHRIQSGYFIEMQKPSFIADMAAQMAKQ